MAKLNRDLWKWQKRKQSYILKLKQLSGGKEEVKKSTVQKKDSPF
ncbi:MAG: hypothetical protein NT094_03925 [Candidatus Staskawiczbacteria bacterium]|nr:hypothetical protein [Candidatus Staskawiczbacteria bacterium]